MFTSRVLPADWDTRLDLMHPAGFFWTGFFFLPNKQFFLLFFLNSLHNVISNLRVNIKTETPENLFFFAYRKSSPLNYASVCSLLATSELLLSLSEHRVLMQRPALTRFKKDGKRVVRWDRPELMVSPTRLVPQKLQKISPASSKKQNKQKEKSTLRMWIHSESEELQLARTDVRTDLEVNPYQSADMRSLD